jgi:hypothetical protein
LIACFCEEATVPALDLKVHSIKTVPDSAIIVGPDGDGTVNPRYVGGPGFLNAIADAVTQGATASNPIDVYVKPGTYLPGDFSLSDGVNLVGLGTDTKCTVSPNPIVIQADYVYANNVNCDVQNISFTPIMLSNAAFNVTSSTVSFNNCYLGNVNASSGTCNINCQNCCLAVPGATSGEANFNFTNCTMSNQLYGGSVASSATFVNTTLVDHFTFTSNDALTVNFYYCDCQHVDYTNNGVLNLNFYASVIDSMNISKVSGNDAAIVIQSDVPPSP